MVQAQEQNMELMEIPQHTDLKQVKYVTNQGRLSLCGGANVPTGCSACAFSVCSDRSSWNAVLLRGAGLRRETLLQDPETFSSAVWKVSTVSMKQPLSTQTTPVTSTLVKLPSTDKTYIQAETKIHLLCNEATIQHVPVGKLKPF